MRRFVLTLVAAWCLLGPGAVALGHDTGDAHPHDRLVPHDDPRAALPDALVTRPVAEAELGTLEPASPAAGSAPETWCGTQTTANDTANAVVAPGTPHLKLVYAYAQGEANRFDTLKHRLQANVSLLARFMAAQSGGRKALRWDMGTSCGAQYVDIQVVALPNPRAHYVPGGAPSFSLVRADVLAAIGGAAAPRDVVVYADGLYGANGTAGTASLRGDDEPGNASHDAGGLAAVVYGPQTLPAGSYAWPTVMLHEIGHNLGAVQWSSPHYSGAGHCFDESDVMCYQDGGESGGPEDMTYTCATLPATMDEALDCGGDDYFAANPPQGSYLDEHWNVYASAHLGACSAELAAQCGLSGAPGDGTAPANTTPAPGRSYRSAWSPALSGSDSESAVDGYQWTVDGGAIQRAATATVSGADGRRVLRTRVRDAQGNWSPWRSDEVFLDTQAPEVSVTCPLEWSTTTAPSCTYSVSDAHARITSVETQRGDTAATAEPYPGASTVGGTIVATADAQRVRVRAVDAAGNDSAWVQDVARWDREDPAASVTCPQGWGNGSTSCRVDASDAGSGLASVTWRAGSGAPAEVAPGAEVAVRAHGAQTITVVATDVAGRTRTATATARVDATPPVVALACPEGWSRAGSCSVTASDPESGLAGRFARIGDGAESDAAGGVTTTATGSHDVVGRAVNGAGASASTAVGRLRIDRSEPSTVLTCPAGWRPAAFECQASGTDGHAGVASIERRVAGAALASLTAASGPVPVTADGDHLVEARAVDAAGNASPWQTTTARLDGSDPVPALACQEGWRADEATCTATATDARSGVASLTWRLAAETQERALPVVVGAHGAHGVVLTATDRVGRTATATATLAVDDTAPTVAVSCPPGWRGAAFDCAVTATDPESGVTARSAAVDGAAAQPASGGAVRIDAAGRHTVVGHATNAVGKSATSGPASAQLDLAAPTATLSCPAGWQPAAFTCRAEGADALSGVAGIQYRLGGGEITSADGASADVPVASDGARTVEARAVDAAGHVSPWRTAEAKLDAAPPAPGLDCPTAWQAGTATCAAAPTDAGAGVASATWTLDGGAARALPVTVPDHGTHAVALKVTDNVGRTATATVTVKVDDTAPTVAIACPAGWRTEAFDCAVSAEDPESGVAARGTSVDGADADGATRRIATEGRHAVVGRATNGAGTTASTAPAAAWLDLAAPTVDIVCESLGEGRHRCRVSAADASGVTALTGRIDGGEPFAITPGAAFERTGPAALTVSAADAFGRVATARRSLAARPQAPAAPPSSPSPPPAPVDPPPSVVPIAPERPKATRLVLGKRLATATIAIRDGRASFTLSAARLAPGTYTLQACAAGTKRCVKRRVTVRRGRATATLTGTLAATKITFAITRRKGGRTITVARGTAAALR